MDDDTYITDKGADEPEEPDDTEPVVISTSLRVIYKPRTGYMPFNHAAQQEWLDGIRKGHSQKRMTELLQLNAAVVNRWISLGNKTEQDWLDEGKSVQWFVEKGRRYRRFWLGLRAAKATAEGLVHEVMVEAAIGQTEVKTVKNKQTGEEEEVIVRRPGDWKAADALSKRMERMDLHPGKVRLQKAEILINEANIARAQAEARRSHAMAELAERGINPVNGLLVYPTSFLEQCRPERRALIEEEMIRLGYKIAPQAAVEAMAAAQSDEEIAEKEAFSARWRAKLAPDEMS